MTWDKTKEILEILNHITAGPVLAIVAFWGLKQIKVTKDAAELSSKRDAYKIAADQCNIFAEKIIPLSGKFQAEVTDGNIKFFDKFDVNIEPNSIKMILREEISKKDLEKIYSSQNLTFLLNYIEGFSMYFVSGVADEKVGYNACGRVYCSTVSKLIPILLPKFEDDLFQNTAKLFLLWYHRNERRKLTGQKEEIEKKLNKEQKIKIDLVGLE